MHNEDIVSVLTSMLTFMIEEIREERKRTKLSPWDEWELRNLLHQSARRTYRLERIAKVLSAVDAETPAELNLS